MKRGVWVIQEAKKRRGWTILLEKKEVVPARGQERRKATQKKEEAKEVLQKAPHGALGRRRLPILFRGKLGIRRTRRCDPAVEKTSTKREEGR